MTARGAAARATTDGLIATELANLLAGRATTGRAATWAVRMKAVRSILDGGIEIRFRGRGWNSDLGGIGLEEGGFGVDG